MNTNQAPMHYYKINEDGTPIRSDFLFSDKIASRNICFHSQGVELLRLDKDGMIFNGQRITDAGEAYAAWMKTMGMMQGQEKLQELIAAAQGVLALYDPALDEQDAQEEYERLRIALEMGKE